MEVLDDFSEEYQPEYAGFGIRLLAFTIDGLILSLIGYLVAGDRVVSFENGISVSFNGIYGLIPATYFLLQWLLLSTTIGKMVLGLKIIDVNKEKMQPVSCIARFFGYILLIVGCWFILGSEKKQALHDLIAKTYVIKK